VKDYSYDKSEFNHGNRLRDPYAAYEEKKNRAKKAYAEKCLKIDPYWRNEKILRWYHHKYKNLIEILLRAPVKLTTSVRSKLTTCFAGEDLSVHVC